MSFDAGVRGGSARASFAGTKVLRLVSVTAVIFLSACPGGQEGSPGTPTSASGPSAAAPRESSRRPQRLTTSVISDPKTFNPILSTDQGSSQAVELIFDPLVRLNAHTLDVEPRLAESWEFNDAGTSCTFHLRRDVRWHDGQPFTADDVVFTFDAIFDPKVPNSAKFILTVDGKRMEVVKLDEHTVRFDLPRPFAPMLNTIAGLEILPAHLLAATLRDGTFTHQWGIDTPPEKIVGTGPYRLVRFVAAQSLQYQANRDYWEHFEDGSPIPAIDERVTLIVPNQDAAYLKFTAGETDVLEPRPEEVHDLQEQADAMKIVVKDLGLDTGTLFVSFNRNPAYYERGAAGSKAAGGAAKTDPRLTWFTDKNFLRAVSHSIDKEAIIQNCFFGLGEPARSDISPENKHFYNPNLKPYGYDLAEARRLLTEGGYVDRNGDGVIEDRNGNAVEFSLTTNSENLVRQKICSVLKEDWTKLGMRVNFRPLEFTTLVEKLDTTFEWDAIVIGFTGGVEPHNGANLLRSSANLHLWRPNQPTPATPWEKEIDELVAKGAAEMNPEKRPAFYWRIQEILREELPMLQLVSQRRFVAYRRRLVDFDATVWGVYRQERTRVATEG